MTQSNLFDYLTPNTPALCTSEEMSASREDLKKTMHRLESAIVPEDVPRLSEISDQFSDFCVNVSLIGQVKAGKTALANALLGVSELLPSDVNPWTSVVTSMHLNQKSPKNKKAIFKFFNAEDWDDLMSNSGRIVQLAKKAKLDSQLEELRDQIAKLKERTEGRLGKNFKMLLGNQHNFSSFDADLVKRYVCLGDDDASEDKEGRFADLTKSADLYLDSDLFSYPVTIADTPGVNDPFLVREAATLNNLRGSDVFVVVLSAHQAFSSVDLGLLRLLKSLAPDRVIIFVNRIDELSEPDAQIREIENHVRANLKKQNVSADIPIIFGSAAWADAAITGHFDNLPEDSIDSLGALVNERSLELGEDAFDHSNIDNLQDVSGVSALRAAIHEKVWNEVFDREIVRNSNEVRRLAERSMIYLSKINDGPNYVPDPIGIQRAMKDLKAFQGSIRNTIAKFETASTQKLQMDISGVYTAFIKAEERNLHACLTKSGKAKDWQPDTEGLRADLNDRYREYVDTVETFIRNVNNKASSVLSDAYEDALGSAEGIRMTPMPVPQVPIPIALMRTMNVDMRASSSFEWLKRKFDKSIFLNQFKEIANDDFKNIVEEICNTSVVEYMEGISGAFETLVAEHAKTIDGLAKTGKAALHTKLQEIVNAENEIAVRLETLQSCADILHALECGLIETNEDAADPEVTRLLEAAE